MHLRFFQLALFAVCSLLLVHSAIAQIIPAPTTPSPIPSPIPGLIGPTPNPTTPPASPPPVNPPPVLERAAPQAATAVIRYGPGYTFNLTPRNDWGRFQKVALQPNQAVMVVLTLSPADLGKPADVQILDGGAIAADLSTIPTPFPAPTFNGSSNGNETTPTPSPGSPADPNDILPYLINTGQIMTVSTTGQLIFHFTTGADIGLHRVSVVVGGNQYFFQFWRQDLSAPNNNPSMLHAY